MKAILFAAGLGTRLKPFTLQMPKAMAPVAGKPMIEWQIGHLKAAGITEIIVNVHHFAEQVIDFLRDNNNFGCQISISDERGQLLDTGGGLLKASWFFANGQPFLVHNVDIISPIDFQAMLKAHRKSGAIATLGASKRETSRYFLFDNNLKLTGWHNTKTGEYKWVDGHCEDYTRLAYSGFQIMNPDVFKHSAFTGVFSVIDMLLQVAKYQPVMAFEHAIENWMDLGKPDQLEKAAALLKKLNY